MKLSKTVKSVLTASLAASMVFSMVGCGGTKPAEEKTAEAPAENAAKEEKPAEEAKSSEPVTIDIFQFKVEIAEELQKAIDLYKSKNPNVTINLTTVGGGDDYGAALRAKFQSGQEPTIFNIGGPQDTKDWAEKLEDLGDQAWVSTAGSTLGAVTVDGKPYGMPMAVEGYGVIYNKAIFEAAGVDVTQVKDLDSMDKAFAALDAKIKSGELKDKFPQLEAVVEFPAKETWVTGLHASNIFENKEFATGTDAFTAKEVKFPNAADFQKYIDLMVKYSPNAKSPQKLNAVDYSTQVDQGLAIERVAAIQQGNWVYGGVKGIDEAVAENLAFLPVGGDSIPLGVPMYWSINKTKSDTERQAAKDFLNWLYTSDEGKDIVVNKFAFIPPFTGYEKFPAQDSLGRDIMKYQQEGKTTPWIFMGYPTNWGQQVLGVNIQKYLAGDMTWEQVISDSQTKWAEDRK